MRILNVDLGNRSYPVIIGQGVLAHAGGVLTERGFNSAPIVIANRTILRLHGSVLLRSLEQAYGPTPIIQIGDGERFKNHSTLLKVYESMFLKRADRRSWIVAFGGGVTGDVAGYAAATFMRGIPYVMIPTTLLAQVDSSIGGKVGINVSQGKNLIGAFHQPAAVLSDTATLNTLSARELATGLYEVIKCGAIRSEPLIRYLERKLPDILSCLPRQMEHIVLEASRIKAHIVASDEKESGLRMILNYGHTVGHSLEAATDYRRFKHGEAVAWGMIAALGFGMEIGLLQAEGAGRLIRLIHRVRTMPSLKGILLEDVWKSLVRDKKFFSGNIRMVLLRGLGEAEVFAHVDPELLRRFLGKFLANNGSVL